MAAIARPDFVVIGQGTLALACCRQLTERGLSLQVVVSQDAAVRRWADARGVSCLPDPASLTNTRLQGKPTLLSIANEQLVPAAVLELFAKAVNFHDGPLPQYAGSHVTSWALLAQESVHAVSWHEMTSKADAGSVLLRVPIPLAADETALTLNAKCHDAALQSFPLLLERMLCNDWSGTSQNPNRRIFYARDRRPIEAGLLDWRRPANELSALIRALTFGPFVNRLGLAKVWLGTAWAAVGSLQVGALRSAYPPGTVVSITEAALQLATATHDVTLRDFMTLDGRALSVDDMVRTDHLRKGMVLPVFPLDVAKAEATQAGGWKEEGQWIDDLRRLKPASSPLRYARSCDTPAGGSLVLSRPLSPMANAVDFALAVLLAWLARNSGTEIFDIGLRYPPANAQPAAHHLLAQTRPFRAHADFNQPFENFQLDCSERLAAWRMRKPYLRDAVVRYPQLARPPGWDDFASWPVVVELPSGGSTCDSTQHPRPLAVTFAIGELGEVTIFHAGLSTFQLEKASAQLATLAHDAVTRPWCSLGMLALLTQDEAAAVRQEAWGSQARG